MPKGYLICETDPGEPRRVPIGVQATVGRAGDCEVVIDDAAASRRHVQILVKRGAFIWKDLGSTNGTLLNGQRMREGILRSGDRLQIGETAIRFELVEEEAPEEEVSESTFFKQTLHDWSAPGPRETAHEKTQTLLRAVYAVMNEISSNYEICSLVDRILETTLQAIDARRGAILFASPGHAELAPCPACHNFHMIEDGALSHVAQHDAKISRTVANHVLTQGESVLFSDSDQDTGLRMVESIVQMQIRSIICVPLRGKSGVIGLLYLDSNKPGDAFGDQDLLLATAVGNSAGLAIDNANLHQQLIEKQRIEQDIEYAWQIQQGFLVKEWPPPGGAFEVYGETRPAKIVGGDFYDFVQPDENHVGILIGDVSGKGVPAALAMAQLLAEFRLLAHRRASPAAVLSALNDGLCQRSQRGMFCTLCYLSLDLSSGAARCANAGHHPVLRLRGKETAVLCGASGPPAGVVSNYVWEDTELEAERGDLFLLYTDGVVEARTQATRHLPPAAPQEFGIDAVAERLRFMPGQPPKAAVEAVIQDVLRFCAPAAPHDDCTLIGLRYG